MSERFCKFCGRLDVAACMDETDLSVFSRTVEHCSDAAFARDAEVFYEGDHAIARSHKGMETP